MTLSYVPPKNLINKVHDVTLFSSEHMMIFDPHYFTTVIDPEILSIGNINLEHIIFIWFKPVHSHVSVYSRIMWPSSLTPGLSELGHGLGHMVDVSFYH